MLEATHANENRTAGEQGDLSSYINTNEWSLKRYCYM